MAAEVCAAYLLPATSSSETLDGRWITRITLCYISFSRPCCECKRFILCTETTDQTPLWWENVMKSLVSVCNLCPVSLLIRCSQPHSTVIIPQRLVAGTQRAVCVLLQWLAVRFLWASLLSSRFLPKCRALHKSKARWKLQQAHGGGRPDARPAFTALCKPSGKPSNQSFETRWTRSLLIWHEKAWELVCVTDGFTGFVCGSRVETARLT